MEPRPIDRGRREVSGNSPPILQGFNGATANRPWKTGRKSLIFSPPTALQWSHGQSTVEDLSCPTDKYPTTCSFNGATANRPWKTTSRNRSITARRAGFNGATANRPWKTLVTVVPIDQYRNASMEPRPIDRGRHEGRPSGRAP